MLFRFLIKVDSLKNFWSGQKYNPDFDRTWVGPDPWDLGPGDGRINITDVQLILPQFGHSCL